MIDKQEEKILKVIKRIRDSFSESVATYTCGRCYHFACILREMFGGELYIDANGGHIYTKINGKFYDIKGNAEKVYYKEDITKSKKLTKEEEWVWDSNYHGATTDVFIKKYKKP